MLGAPAVRTVPTIGHDTAEASGKRLRTACGPWSAPHPSKHGGQFSHVRTNRRRFAANSISPFNEFARTVAPQVELSLCDRQVPERLGVFAPPDPTWAPTNIHLLRPISVRTLAAADALSRLQEVYGLAKRIARQMGIAFAPPLADAGGQSGAKVAGSGKQCRPPQGRVVQ